MTDIVYSKQSPYQKIVLEKLDSGKYLLELDGAVQFVSGRDEKLYHHALAVAPALRVNGPVNALILGGGDGLAARDLLALPKVRKVTMVELDPDMIEMAATHPIMRQINRDVFKNPKLKTLIRDARDFVREKHPELWNLIVVDFPDPTPALQGLYSEDFYQQMTDHLDGLRGVVSVQSSDQIHVPRMVASNLTRATHVPSKILSFLGQDTRGGYMVRGGIGSL